MKAGNGQNFEQCSNTQTAVEVASRLIVGERVGPAPNDKQELVATLAALPVAVGSMSAALVDSGFFSAAAVSAVEQVADGTPPSGTQVYAAVEVTGHHRSVADLEVQTEPAPPPAGASAKEVMRHRLPDRGGQGAL